MTGLSRRDFLKISVSSIGGLWVGIALPGKSVHAFTRSPQSSPSSYAPDIWLHIAPDNTLTVTVHRSEMGQGVQTAIPMILAEELDADWDTVRAQQGPPDPVYGDQRTEGSYSISTSYTILRQAGAAARMMLIAAAAEQWGVPAESCSTAASTVIHEESGQRATYGELAEAAARQPLPTEEELILKDPANFTIIGTRKPLLGHHDMLTGSTIYGTDIRLPGMLYAVVLRSPVFGGDIVSYNSDAALAVPGVQRILKQGSILTVLATNTWAAMKGRDLLDVTWTESPYQTLSSEGIRQQYADAIETLKTEVNPPPAGTTLEAVYELPYMAHAPMETPCCTIDLKENQCEAWIPSQTRQQALEALSTRTGVPASAITLHTPVMGGSFGRRLRMEYVLEAALIAMASQGPVQVFWPREDDMQHSYYRPNSLNWMRATLDESGLPLDFVHCQVSQEGAGWTENIASRFPYRTEKQIKTARVELPIRTGAWRAVTNNQMAFAQECFMDEMAAASGRDPVEYRLALLDDDRRRAVLELAAEQAGWATPPPEGRARGVAMYSTWSVTPVAQIVEISVDRGGNIRVHRVVCAVDCGIVINPDIVEAQIAGGIIFALSAALYGEITIQDGRVEQSNFDDYPVLRYDQIPDIEVHIVPSTRNPAGIGEMGVPPLAPALANAVSAATGKRIRRLPIRPADLI